VTGVYQLKNGQAYSAKKPRTMSGLRFAGD
jgi:hypothetical protein